MNEYYMKIALNEAKKAYKIGEIPVGAIIIYKNKIISKAHNEKEKKHNAIYHAEIIAIKKACKKLKKWRLDDCILYTTMEPCMMCCGSIEQSRIKKIIYGVENEKYGFSSHLLNVEIESKILENECKNLIQSFFKDKR